MAGPITGSRGSFVYNSDDGGSYAVNHSIPKALAGGFAIGVSSGGSKPSNMKMRYVRGAILGSGGADSAPATIELPIASATDPLFTGSTGSFAITYPFGTLTYNVTGRFGEKRERLAAS